MGFIHPVMKTAHPGHGQASKDISPRHPSHGRHVSQRPELIGGLPLWLVTRASQVLSQHNTTKTETKKPGTTLREIANVVDAYDEELATIRAEVVRLQRALDARVGGGTENATSKTCTLLFTELCRLQTRFCRAERQLGQVRRLVKVLKVERDGFQGDLVMTSLAFLGLLVAFFGYIAESRDVFGMLGRG